VFVKSEKSFLESFFEHQNSEKIFQMGSTSFKPIFDFLH